MTMITQFNVKTNSLQQKKGEVNIKSSTINKETLTSSPNSSKDKNIKM